jgi:hypothetical protein
MQTAVVGTTGFAYTDSLATRMPTFLRCVFKALQNTIVGFPRDRGACQQMNASGWCGIERCGECPLLTSSQRKVRTVDILEHAATNAKKKPPKRLKEESKEKQITQSA